MKFLVIEMQTSVEGQVSSAVYTFDTREEAESKWHMVLSYAAVGGLPMHAASLLRSDGALLDRKCYVHAQPEPEPEPEPREEVVADDGDAA